MKRVVVKLSVALLLFGVLLASTGVTAFAVFPAPADGQRVALSVDNPRVYEYPVSSGTWYIDGVIRNNRHADYSSWVNVVSPHATVEFLNECGCRRRQPDLRSAGPRSGVLRPASSLPGGYFRVFHQEIDVPTGANPTKTRFAVEVPTSDPRLPQVPIRHRRERCSLRWRSTGSPAL